MSLESGEAESAETRTPSTYRKKVLSSLAWQGSAQLVGQVLSWASTIFVIRLLDGSDYGLMAMANLFVSFILMMSDLGVGAAIVQAEELERKDLRAIQALVLMFNGVGFVLTLLAAPLMALFFEEPGLVPILWVLSVNFLLLGTYIVPQSRLMRDLRFDRKARVDVLALMASAATSLTLASLGYGVWALVGGTIAVHVMRAIGFNWVLRDALLPLWSLERGWRFIRFGSVIVLDRFLWFLYSNMDVTIAGKLLGAELLGFYTVALTLAAIPLDKVLPVLTQVAFPAVARIQKEPERVRQNMLTAFRYANLVFLPVFWGMAWVAADAFPILLGEKWEASIVPFQIICVILPLKAIGALLPPALFGLGRPGVNVVNMAISLVLLTAGFAVGSSRGLVGLASAWLVVYPVVFVITTSRALPVIGLRWRDMIAGWRGAWLAAAVMSAAVWSVQAVAGDWLPAVRLVSAIAAGAVGYVGTILLVERAAVAELRGLLAR